MRPLNRRSFLATTALAAVMPAMGFRSLSGQAPPVPAPPSPRKKSLRVAHLTDMHIQPELGADRGVAQCLHQTQSLEAKPDLILTGGDGVMDVFEAKAARASDLKKMFTSTFAKECGIPARHTIGNHDIFGWNKKSSGTTGAESDWGKKYAAEMYGLPNRFYSFDQGGWHFVMLDSVQPQGEGSYTAFCDDEQTEWLVKDLKGRPAGSPVLVVSHIPIMSLTPITYGKARPQEARGTDYPLSASAMHSDCAALHKLFAANGVKLCLSGHMHLLDRCSTDGVTYICDGAVSANWWKGPLQGVSEGFGVIDLYSDGSFEHEYKTYGWKAEHA
ncbi:MAG: metallophosphoesterase [Planctomycetes bacterium]|nr:metallophosphoesterase [Planctomycetota bacterium]